jgi:hypothetical protein
MVALKDPVSSLSNLPKTHVLPFLSSTVSIGREGLLRSVKIGLPAPDHHPALLAGVASVALEAMVAVGSLLVVAVGMAVAALAEDMAEGEEVSVEATVVVEPAPVVMVAAVVEAMIATLLQPCLIPSPIMPRRVANAARSSTSATCHGLPVTRTW